MRQGRNQAEELEVFDESRGLGHGNAVAPARWSITGRIFKQTVDCLASSSFLRLAHTTVCTGCPQIQACTGFARTSEEQAHAPGSVASDRQVQHRYILDNSCGHASVREDTGSAGILGVRCVSILLVPAQFVVCAGPDNCRIGLLVLGEIIDP